MNKTFGILHLSDRCIIKDGKKTSKRFTSFDKNIGTLNIKTKKTNMHDIYCIVNIKENCVEEYLDSITYNNIPKYISMCNWKKIKINIDDYIFNQPDITPNRIDLLHIDNIISIDPYGSLDIDDAIHYKRYDNHIEIGIHIADPSSYIKIDSEFDIELQNRCQSLYFKDETKHMLPSELSTNIISLRENEIKRAYSLLIKFNTINYNEYEYEFKKSYIRVNKNLTYDDAQIIVDSDLNTYNLNNLFDLAKLINLNYKINFNDAHDMIALYMIFANNLCGIKLKNILSIVRVNNKKNIKINLQENLQEKIQENLQEKIQENLDDKLLLKLYDNCLQTKAEYKLNIDNIKHEGLNIEYYTQFTSPIRRYQDLIIHRILYGDIYEQDVLEKLIDKMNHCSYLYKFASNLDKLNDLLDDNNFIEIKCKIIFIDNDSMSVYYDIKNIILKIDYVNYKIKDIIDKKNNYDSIELNINNIYYNFKLFQDISVKIYRLKLSIQMFKIILDII